MQTAEELTMTALSLVFLLLGTVLIASIVFSAFNPYEQIAVANTRKLAALMNQACVSEGSSSTLQFDLQQNVPIGSNFLTVLPAWLMRNYGDPNFVVYYESFPPGEGIGWETYNAFDNRLYIILPEKNPNSPDGIWTINDVQKYVDSKRTAFANNSLEGTVVANIVLNDAYPGITAEKQDVNKGAAQALLGNKANIGQGGGSGGAGATGSFQSQETQFFGFGAWQSANKNGIPGNIHSEDYFSFQNYQGMPTVEKTLIKYESCGPYSLCLKTRSGVYRFPLTNCMTKPDFKTVQLVYDARNRKAVYGTLGVIIGATVAAVGTVGVGAAGVGEAVEVIPGIWVTETAASSTSILSEIASGISAAFRWTVGKVWSAGSLGKLAVGSTVAYAVDKVAEKFLVATLALKTGDLALASPCQITEAQVVFDSCTQAAIPNSLDYSPCTTYIKYPIFSVNKETGKLSKEGDHYECADKIETKPDHLNINDALHDHFILENNTGGKCVQVKVFDQPNGFCWTPDPSASSIGVDWRNADTRALAWALGFTPVRDSLQYFPLTQDISLLPTITGNVEDNNIKWQRSFSWGWPFERVVTK